MEAARLLGVGMGQRIRRVAWPLARPAIAAGLALINWIADRRVREPVPGLTAPDRADWSRPGQLDDLLPVFR